MKIKGNHEIKAVSYNTAKKMFKRHSGNRNIIISHVKELKKEFLTNNGFCMPITVNDTTKNILDGQHRFEAIKQLVEEKKIDINPSIYVQFVHLETPEEEIQWMQKINNVSKHWTINDYINAYSSTDENCAYLTNWAKQHNIDNFGLVGTYFKGKNCRQALLKGTFSITDEDKKHADIMFNEINQIADALQTGINESLVCSWNQQRVDFNIDDVVKYTKKNRFYLKHFRNVQSQKDWQDYFNKVREYVRKAQQRAQNS